MIKVKSTFILSKGCSSDLIPLKDSKVTIDPKDIISSKDIYSFLKEHQNLPQKRLKIRVGKNFLRGKEGFGPTAIKLRESDELYYKIR